MPCNPPLQKKCSLIKYETIFVTFTHDYKKCFLVFGSEYDLIGWPDKLVACCEKYLFVESFDARFARFLIYNFDLVRKAKHVMITLCYVSRKMMRRFWCSPPPLPLKKNPNTEKQLNPRTFPQFYLWLVSGSCWLQNKDVNNQWRKTNFATM